MKIAKKLIIFAFTVILFAVISVMASAETYGSLTYTLENSQITITDCDVNASGIISIPEKINGYTVTTIQPSAFDSCSLITEINIPATVSKLCTEKEPVGAGVFDFAHNFYKCDSLESINVDSTNNYYASENGILYNKNKNRIIRYPSAKKDTTFVIPKSVNWLSAWSFSGTKHLKEVVFEDKYYTFGDYIFANSTNLRSVNLPEHSSSYTLTLSEGMFMNCTSIESITIPAVYEKASIGTFDKNRVYIGPFYECTGLKKVDIYCSIIDEGMFAYCTNLSSVTLNGNIKTISNGAFYNCENLYEINIPNTVTNIGEAAFYNCSSLSKITIPENTTHIGKLAFYNCASLKNIIWNAKNVSDFNFSSEIFYNIGTAENETIVKFGDAVESIPAYLFSFSNAKVSNVSIGKSVKSIGISAFEDCNLLKDIVIPKSVEVIGENAFSFCTSLTNVTIPKNVTNIEDDAFSWCSSLEKVIIENGVKKIGNGAFHKCINLQEVNIPNSITEIGNSAFYCCDSLTSITIPNSVTKIDACAFGYGSYHAYPIAVFTIYGGSGSAAEAYANKNDITFVTTDFVYNVKYYANNGFGVPASQTKDYGIDLTLSSTVPTRTGYTFLGWSTSSTATSATYSAGGTYSANSDVTLYAVWKANTYYVKYNANGGTGSMSNSTHTFGVKQALTANTYTRTGYTFLGWARSKSATTPDYTDCKEVSGLTGVNGRIVNLYAVWQPINYSVKYNANGGTGTMANSSHTFGVSKALSANKFTRTGYTFLGWSKTKNATTASYVDCKEVSGLTGVDGKTVVLYAVWKPNTYTVKYHANGGTGTMAASSFTYGVAQKLRANSFTRTGYIFKGWKRSTSATTAMYTDAQSVKNLLSKPNNTLTLYAVWEPINYSVKYNANGGTGIMANSSHTFGTAKALSANKYTRTGYIFLGWSKDKNATTASYVDGKAVSGLTGVDGRVVNLYAVWQPINYSVKYNANGGTGTMENSNHTFGVSKALSANKFTRTGYIFLGWSKTKNATTATYTNKQAVKGLTGVDGKTVVLYAVWQKK